MTNLVDLTNDLILLVEQALEVKPNDDQEEVINNLKEEYISQIKDRLIGE